MKSFIDKEMRKNTIDWVSSGKQFITGFDIYFRNRGHTIGGWQIDLEHSSEYRVDKWGTTK